MALQTFVEMGEYDEHSVVLQRVIRLEALAETRAGHVVMRDGRPHFPNTLIGLDDGSSIVVPHTKNEVLRRFLEAVRSPDHEA